MASKGSELRRRLNNLEEDLKCLRERVALQRVNMCTEKDKDDKQLLTLYKRSLTPVAVDNNFQCNKYEKDLVLHKKLFEHQGRKSRKAIFCEDPLYSCLQNIDRNIAKGSEAIRTIASLTKISSLTSANYNILEKKVGFSTGDHIKLQPSNSVTRTSATLGMRIRKGYGKFTSNDEFGYNTSTLKELQNEKAVRKKLEAENQLLKDKVKLLKRQTSELDKVKKKLREEESLRIEAEKLALEPKSRDCTSEENHQDNISKFREEICMMKEHIKSLKIELEETKRQKAEVFEGNRLAMAMADQVREKYEQLKAELGKSSYTISSLKEKNKELLVALEEAKAKKESKTVENIRLRKELGDRGNIKRLNEMQKQIDELTIRAEKAEFELTEKSNECEKLKGRDPFDEPEVIEVLLKHKRMFQKLKMEKRDIEDSLNFKCKQLERQIKDIGNTQQVKYQQLKSDFEEAKKTLASKDDSIITMAVKIDGLSKRLEEESKRVEEMIELNKEQGKHMQSLAETIQSKDTQIQSISKEMNATDERANHLERQLQDAIEKLSEKERTIEDLRVEVENEKDRVLIKDKMLTDQLDTIKCLRRTMDEIQGRAEKDKTNFKNLVKEFNILEKQSDEIKGRAAQLEYELQLARTSKSKDEENKAILQELETQVYKRQREWENQISKLSQEKFNAIQAGRLANQQLLRAVSGYELQITSYKNTLAQISQELKEKKAKLEYANHEITKLTEKLWNVSVTAGDSNNYALLNNNNIKLGVCKLPEDRSRSTKEHSSYQVL